MITVNQRKKSCCVVNINGSIKAGDGSKDNGDDNDHTTAKNRFDEYCIALLATHPDCQNMGLGKMLMTSATEHARQMRFKTMVITVLEMKYKRVFGIQRLAF
ncbi:hypothetical protein BDB00DRAFT_815812 [Zychaea mexicana]|uniref:uncharacterized protein n=1 Tax=Zychaea mexicana TaxID=64656 RepID=UPI0022FE4D69|nr:uncharacterized protein BDB00DRAFT_815812 [Zychaea mexicana]KAI9495088.1 hypothetical protein BDB00DRAFT_815812 [Zychaea mexicana]